MGRKNIVPNFQMFGAAGCDLSVASTTSSFTETKNIDNIGIVMNWTGSSPVGTIDVQVSNDQITWASLDFGSAIAVSGNSGNNVIDIAQLPYAFLQLVYTKVSGTGTLFASISAKQIGG